MKKAIAMKCTQEQWDSIKGRIPKEIKTHIRSFDNNNVLVNNWEDMGIVSNCCPEHSRILKSEYFSTFNAKIFLDACGIETDVYKITKEQVLELSKMNCVIKEKFCDLFPDAFKKELEVGKWYKITDKNNQFTSDECALVLYSDKNGTHTGFGYRKTWTTTFKNLNEVIERGTDIVEEATPQEVEDALISEWKRIGGKLGATISRAFAELSKIKTINTFEYPHDKEFYYDFKQDYLEHHGIVVYYKGKFATIIQPEKMTLEQIEKELGRKIELI